jgi:hypothetical protein
MLLAMLRATLVFAEFTEKSPHEHGFLTPIKAPGAIRSFVKNRN